MFSNIANVVQEAKKGMRSNGFEGGALTETAQASCGMGLGPAPGAK